MRARVRRESSPQDTHPAKPGLEIMGEGTGGVIVGVFGTTGFDSLAAGER